MNSNSQKILSAQNTSTAFQLTALVTHVFCCGLPAVAAATGLIGAGGITLLPLWAERFFHRMEVPLFLFSAVLVAFSVLAHFWAQRQAAGCDDLHCHNHSHTPAHAHSVRRLRQLPWFLVLAVCVLVLNAYLTFGIQHYHSF